MASVTDLLALTNTVATAADRKIDRIHGITRRSRMLALNATIQAQHAGTMGRGFAVVADEVKAISSEIARVTDELRGELRAELAALSQFGQGLAAEIDRLQGERLADLAHNAVEIADRNLYERSCDVRWWATDPAVVNCATQPDNHSLAQLAAHRLAVILDSYTVYLDLWIADAQGRIVATGRPNRYPGLVGSQIGGQDWFQAAMNTNDGGSFTVADIHPVQALNGAVAALYATAIRADGESMGRPVGALGILFDWQSQGQNIVEGIRLSPREWQKSRCLLLDRNHRIIADSHGIPDLETHFPLDTSQGERGYYRDQDGDSVGYALTPGYETYRGLGWYGVVVQQGNS